MAYAYLFKYIIIGDTGKQRRRVSYFRSAGVNDVVQAEARGVGGLTACFSLPFSPAASLALSLSIIAYIKSIPKRVLRVTAAVCGYKALTVFCFRLGGGS